MVKHKNVIAGVNAKHFKALNDDILMQWMVSDVLVFAC